jgi:uncharacterized protein (DUF2384 family)
MWLRYVMSRRQEYANMVMSPTSPVHLPWDTEWDQIREDVERAQSALAAVEVVPDEVHKVVLRLGDRLEAISDSELQGVDPYVVLAIQGGTIQALRAFEMKNNIQVRRGVRVGLERVRQALRDVADESALADDRPVKLVVRWLVETLDAPNPRVAELLQTSPRTLQRWLSPDATQPRGEDASRVRLVAKVTNQLRHVLTGEGVLRWFESPSVALSERRPAELLANLEEAPRLIKLAASSRVSVAT